MIDWDRLTPEGAVLAYAQESFRRTRMAGTLSVDPDMPRGGEGLSEEDWVQLAGIVRHDCRRSRCETPATCPRRTRFDRGVDAYIWRKRSTLGPVTWDKSDPNGDAWRVEDASDYDVAKQMGITVAHVRAVIRDCLNEVAEHLGDFRRRH